MRILHLNTETGFRGGERQVELLMLGLRARGHEQVLFAREEGQLAAKLRTQGFAVFGYQKPPFHVHNPMLRSRVREIARGFAPQIIHAHTGNAHALALGAFGGRVPVVSTRRVDFAVGGNWLSRRRYAAPGQHYIAISRGVRDVLIAGGVVPDRISIVHSGIETARLIGGDRAKLRQEWRVPGTGPLIGFIGALVDHKAPWILAEAALLLKNRLPESRIVFVGEGEERPKLEAIAARSDGRIHLAGWREDVANCYAAFDLFVMPSKLEGLCTSLVDALAAGVPSIASAVGGIPDVIVHRETGMLVPPLRAEILADAIAELWANGELRTRFTQQGRAHVEVNFTAEAMVAGTEAVYRQVLG